MPRIPKLDKNTKRLTLNMTAETRRLMEELRERTGADTLGEVVRKSLALYDVVTEDRKARFFVEKEDERLEIRVI